MASNRADRISMASKMATMIPVACIVVLVLACNDAEATFGMNWGRLSAQRLVPSQVVDLLLQNGIGQARVYSSEEDILEAFAGSGINLTVTVFNAAKFTTLEDARTWVRSKSRYFEPSNIRTIYLGGYVFGDWLTNRPMRLAAMQSLQHLQYALNEAGHGQHVKATFLHTGFILKKYITKPSEAEFRDEILEDMAAFLRFIKENNAPFVIELFPIVEASMNNFHPGFAFPDNKSSLVVTDRNGAVYTNVFEFMIDSYIWALNKLGAFNLKIIVGQVGWPTDGFFGATAENAERFFKGLLPLVASNKGTPMRPGMPIDIYIHSLTDENRMPHVSPFGRHWGIYRSNGEPKYKIDLSGQGRDVYPTKMKGIMRMPDRWCVFNGDRTDSMKVEKAFRLACKKSDCTTMAPGGSCSQLTYNQNISYAFNMYFQFKYQDEKACDFGGLGHVSAVDPSTHECVFPVEVVRGQQINLATPGKGFHHRPNCAIFVFLLSLVLGTLIWD